MPEPPRAMTASPSIPKRQSRESQIEPVTISSKMDTHRSSDRPGALYAFAGRDQEVALIVPKWNKDIDHIYKCLSRIHLV